MSHDEKTTPDTDDTRQGSHDPETEEDSASGGAPEEPETKPLQ